MRTRPDETTGPSWSRARLSVVIDRPSRAMRIRTSGTLAGDVSNPRRFRPPPPSRVPPGRADPPPAVAVEAAGFVRDCRSTLSSLHPVSTRCNRYGIVPPGRRVPRRRRRRVFLPSRRRRWVGRKKRLWRWRGSGADGAGVRGVVLPQRWVQLSAQSARRLRSYGRRRRRLGERGDIIERGCDLS